MIILKILLKINNLEKTTLGGMNSFLLFHLVYYYFVVIKNSTKTENEFQLLHNFLFYYGFEFDNNRYMLDMKGIKSEMIYKKNIILSVKTTLSENDIGGQCKKYDEIKKLFQQTSNKINNCINELEFSILSKLDFNNINL